jgi:DNA-directed RNA polymerase subunit RPC12/RpoP
MPMTFNCPNCGAQLDYQGGNTSLICAYCGSSALVPAELQQAQAQEEARKMLTWPELRKNRWFQVGVVLFFVIFVLPTCLGVFGSLIGIIAGVGAPILAVILQTVLGR